MVTEYAEASIGFAYDSFHYANTHRGDTELIEAVTDFCRLYSDDQWSIYGFYFPHGIYSLTLNFHFTGKAGETKDTAFLDKIVVGFVHAFDGYMCAKFGERIDLGLSHYTHPEKTTLEEVLAQVSA